MRKKLLIMTLALMALLGLGTIFATAASGGESTDTLYVGAGQGFETLDEALNHAAMARSAVPVEIVLQSDTTMNTTARSLPQDVTIKSDEGGPYTVTNTADYVVDGGQNLTLENVIFASSEGTAFQVNNGTLVTSGAVTLAGNRIIVNSGNSATIDDGTTISGNSATSGGGVYVDNGGTFTMNGGEISNNSTTNDGGGGVYVNTGGTFTMNGGTISGNTTAANRTGGGVCVHTGGTFTMTGGTISNNTTAYGGGVYIYNNATFTMNNGEISNNSTTNDGGGVYVDNGGTFTMTGGTITGNTTSVGFGNGVYIKGGTFTMTGGTISKNTSSSLAGGVCFDNGVFNLSGTPVIKDNFQNNSPSNVILFADQIINLTGPLTNGAEVWIRHPIKQYSVFAHAEDEAVARGSAKYFNDDQRVYSTLATENNDLIWDTIVAELYDNGSWVNSYSSLDDAIADYKDSNTQMILMRLDSTTTTSTVDKDLYLDLNGYNITGLTINDGCRLYGLDSATDDYMGTGYGKVTTVSGGSNIATYTDTNTAHTTKEKRYITVTEGNNEVSFHRYNVQVSDYYFRLEYDDSNDSDPKNAIINFSTAVQGDSKVADAVTGLELSSSAAGVTEEKTSATASDVTALQAALNAGNPYYYRSHFIFISNPYTTEYALKATLSLTLSDGKTATATTTKDRTLRDILSYFYGSATQEQKNTINAFLTRNNLPTLS